MDPSPSLHALVAGVRGSTRHFNGIHMPVLRAGRSSLPHGVFAHRRTRGVAGIAWGSSKKSSRPPPKDFPFLDRDRLPLCFLGIDHSGPDRLLRFWAPVNRATSCARRMVTSISESHNTTQYTRPIYPGHRSALCCNKSPGTTRNTASRRTKIFR